MENRWNPWAALRARPDVEFGLADLPAVVGGAVFMPQSEGWSAILIDRGRPRRERRALLAHELVHHEQGGSCPTDGLPPEWNVIAQRQERRVEREVARRLVPLDELRQFLERMTGSELGGATARDIADHFDVPENVAVLAVRELGQCDG